MATGSFWTEQRAWLLVPTAAVAAVAVAWTLARLAPTSMEFMGVLVLAHLEAGILALVLAAFIVRPLSQGLLWFLAVAAAATVLGLTVTELKHRDDADPGLVAYGVPLALFVYSYIHTFAYIVSFRPAATAFLIPFLSTPSSPLTTPPPTKEGAPADSS
jgi:hypothetical protein